MVGFGRRCFKGNFKGIKKPSEELWFVNQCKKQQLTAGVDQEELTHHY